MTARDTVITLDAPERALQNANYLAQNNATLVEAAQMVQRSQALLPQAEAMGLPIPTALRLQERQAETYVKIARAEVSRPAANLDNAVDCLNHAQQIAVNLQNPRLLVSLGGADVIHQTYNLAVIHGKKDAANVALLLAEDALTGTKELDVMKTSDEALAAKSRQSKRAPLQGKASVSPALRRKYSASQPQDQPELIKYLPLFSPFF